MHVYYFGQCKHNIRETCLVYNLNKTADSRCSLCWARTAQVLLILIFTTRLFQVCTRSSAKTRASSVKISHCNILMHGVLNYTLILFRQLIEWNFVKYLTTDRETFIGLVLSWQTIVLRRTKHAAQCHNAWFFDLYFYWMSFALCWTTMERITKITCVTPFDGDDVIHLSIVSSSVIVLEDAYFKSLHVAWQKYETFTRDDAGEIVVLSIAAVTRTWWHYVLLMQRLHGH